MQLRGAGPAAGGWPGWGWAAPAGSGYQACHPRRVASGGLDSAHAVACLRTLQALIGRVHQRGLVHGAIVSSNIIVSGHGDLAPLLVFGHAALVAPEAAHQPAPTRSAGFERLIDVVEALASAPSQRRDLPPDFLNTPRAPPDCASSRGLADSDCLPKGASNAAECHRRTCCANVAMHRRDVADPGGKLTGLRTEADGDEQRGGFAVRTGSTFAADNDPELIRAAVPFSLKLVDSLLAELPRHHGLLLTACSGFTQYSYAFLESDAEFIKDGDYRGFERLQDRSRGMYLRARDYCLRSLELKYAAWRQARRGGPAAAALVRQGRGAPYWAAAAWGRAIRSPRPADAHRRPAGRSGAHRRRSPSTRPSTAARCTT